MRDNALKGLHPINTAFGPPSDRDRSDSVQHSSPRFRNSMTHTGRLAPVKTFLSSAVPRDLGPRNEVDRLRSTLEYINFKDEQGVSKGTYCAVAVRYTALGSIERIVFAMCCFGMLCYEVC